MRHEIKMNYAGGTTIVELTRFKPGAAPNAFIVKEPLDASPGRTLVRDQVNLLNAIRDMLNPRLLEVVAAADTRCRDLFCAAMVLRDHLDPAAPKETAA